MPFLFRELNALAVLGITGILAYALFDQFAYGDLPCPLCLLQRVGFGLVGVGFALNVLFGCRPSHYALAILGGAAGAIAAARQILLHIVPGTGSYGDPLFGLHFYSWAFVAFAMAILGAAALMLFESQFERPGDRSANGWRAASWLGRSCVGLFVLVIVVNAVSTFAECGLGPCADDPAGYALLDGVR